MVICFLSGVIVISISCEHLRSQMASESEYIEEGFIHLIAEKNVWVFQGK